jgi:hypothetical protein
MIDPTQLAASLVEKVDALESSLTQTPTETPPAEAAPAAVTPVTPETPPATPPTPPQDNPFEIKAKELEVKVKEYEERLSQVPTEDKIFANESIKKLNDLAKAGIDVNSDKFWKWQAVDLDKITPDTVEGALTLKRLELEVEMPELNPAEIERLLKKQFSDVMSGKFSPEDTEYQEALIDLQIAAKASRTKLRSHKESVTLPKVDIQKQEAEKETARRNYEAYVLDVKKEVNAFTELPLKVDEKTELKFQADEATKKYIEASLVNHQTYLRDNYVSKEGVVDYARFNRDATILRNFDKISKMLVDQGISIGKELVAESLENSTVTPQGQKQEVTKTFEEQVAEQFQKQRPY